VVLEALDSCLLKQGAYDFDVGKKKQALSVDA
jgi:hypothetical protein